MCCMIIEKTMVIENGLLEVQMAFRKELGHIIINKRKNKKRAWADWPHQSP